MAPAMAPAVADSPWGFCQAASDGLQRLFQASTDKQMGLDLKMLG